MGEMEVREEEIESVLRRGHKTILQERDIGGGGEIEYLLIVVIMIIIMIIT